MFPFERFMAVLKKYVRKCSRPEGCIAKGYGTEEVIEFCVDYLPDLNPFGLPVSTSPPTYRRPDVLFHCCRCPKLRPPRTSSSSRHCCRHPKLRPPRTLSSSRAARSAQPGRPAAPPPPPPRLGVLAPLLRVLAALLPPPEAPAAAHLVVLARGPFRASPAARLPLLGVLPPLLRRPKLRPPPSTPPSRPPPRPPIAKTDSR
ncbi:hypothetical protein PAHAL_1G233700 [Panicum hallii]|uniref:DUF4218 domain-containing protein n=1 Tax=Panicum hallii TaxID=206008 RepID=A0A2T8KW50_9POAL|nr:hypothetical protein PAHAL_1G233700 [Panicum hallii]